MKDCPFCSIIEGKTPARRIHEDEITLAFLDRYPISRGHALVITRKHIPLMTDIEPDDFGAIAAPFLKTVYAVSRKMKRALGCRYVTLLLRGVRVPHVHMHLIPSYESDPGLLDLTLQLQDFCQPRLKPRFTDKELDALAEKIKQAPVK